MAIKTRKRDQRACDKWNAKHEVGTRIRFWYALSQSGKRLGDPVGAVTLAKAFVMGGHTPVVPVRKDGGGTDHFALTHIEPDQAATSEGTDANSD